MSMLRTSVSPASIIGLALVAVFSGRARGQDVDFPPSGKQLSQIEALAHDDSNEASLHYYRGLGYWGKHKFDEADSALRLAIQLDPRYADAYLALAYLPYVRRDQLFDEEMRDRIPDAWKPRLEESNRFYQRAFMIDPLVSLRIISLVWRVDERGFRDYTSEESQLYQLYLEGFVDLSKGRYGLAYDRFVRLARTVYDEEKHPEKVPNFLLWHRGLAAAHSLKYDAAIADFQVLLDRAERKERQDALMRVPLRTNEYRFMLAALERAAGHLDKAEARFKEAAANDLGLYMAHVYLADIYEQQKRWPEAVTEHRRAVEANPDDYSLELDLGMLLFNLEQTKEAQGPIEKAVALYPRAALAHYLLGRIGEELGRPADAKTHLAQFVALAPHRLDDLVGDAKQRLAKLP
jgi:tetratricopeptide (TPR) repeat protein